MAGMRFSVRALFVLTTAAALVVWLAIMFPYTFAPFAITAFVLILMIAVGSFVAGPIGLAVVAALFYAVEWLTKRLRGP